MKKTELIIKKIVKEELRRLNQETGVTDKRLLGTLNKAFNEIEATLKVVSSHFKDMPNKPYFQVRLDKFNPTIAIYTVKCKNRNQFIRRFKSYTNINLTGLGEHFLEILEGFWFRAEERKDGSLDIRIFNGYIRNKVSDPFKHPIRIRDIELDNTEYNITTIIKDDIIDAILNYINYLEKIDYEDIQKMNPQRRR